MAVAASSRITEMRPKSIRASPLAAVRPAGGEGRVRDGTQGDAAKKGAGAVREITPFMAPTSSNPRLWAAPSSEICGGGVVVSECLRSFLQFSRVQLG